ncbi:MAG: ACT domain-containing protein [Ferruginibacter sp.]
MTGEKNLAQLLTSMQPVLNEGEYVFCTTADISHINPAEVIALFKEKEGYTVILEKELADRSGFEYSFVAAWITLTVHSSLEAVGLTAAFSNALSEAGISCNVVAAYFHDHIFVNKRDAGEAMKALQKLSGS